LSEFQCHTGALLRVQPVYNLDFPCMPDQPAFSHSRSMLATGALRVSDSLGRFELKKILGRGAQSTVWLAFDPRMEREVAIKVMRAGSGSDARALSQWLDEARSVGRVKHPNIVPVYEADIHDQQPYLVFEYIAGSTLDQVIKQRGAMAPHEAVALMMDVLDAVAVAHAAGVIHRDLKPSNVLIDAAGHARVTDFGIAARIRDSTGTQPVVPSGGTPGYLSPEAANGAAPAASMDVFSAGVVLAEMLMGRSLVDEADPYRAIYRVAHEQLVLPADLNPEVDDRLRAIVLRALARDPKQRFLTARALLEDLEQWAKPAAVETQGESTGASGTLDFLLRRMRHKSDFPALSDSVVRIQSMATSETESVNSVTNEILKDVALTNKLLRMVNSAHYAHTGSINTVSRAVNLVGFNGIRNMALSLVLLEHMQDKAHAGLLKEEFLRCLMAGSIGEELCTVAKESEEAFIGSMFQNLGRLLVQFYFPEEASQIRNLVHAKREPQSEDAAAAGVLGLNFEALGLGIAKAWGLPQSMQRCMRKPVGTVPSKTPSDTGERMRWLALAANEIADTLLHTDPQDAEVRVDAVARKYAQALGVNSKELHSATSAARQKLVDLANAMEIRVKPGSPAANLLKTPHTVEGEKPNLATEGNLGSFELHATHAVPPQAPGNTQQKKEAHVTQTLTAGIQDITNAMVEDFKLSDVLRMILETMFRAMQFDRIIFCMRDAKTETMTGRFGLGEGVEQQVKAFKVPLKAATPDLFSVVCNKGTDTMISDSTESRIAQRLPDWYRSGLNAPTFLLLPLYIKGSPFGLIYADKKAHGALDLDDKELALLRTLRNQAVMAFKQSS
jgi:serine/threonine protein kinase